MKKITSIITLLISLLTVSFGQTLDGYIKIAAENNPELKAYFNDYMGAMQQITPAGTLPDPEVSFAFFVGRDGFFMERLMGNQNAEIQFMQMFPWFGMLRTRKDEAAKMALARYEVFQDARNRLFFQVKNTWYQLYRLKEEIRIAEANLEILRKYERLALIRFQSSGTGGSSGNNQGSGSMSKPQGTLSTTSTGSMGGGMNTGSKTASSGMVSTSVSMSSGNASMSVGRSGMSDVLRVRMEIRELERTVALLQDSRPPLVAEFNSLINRNYKEPVTMADTLSDTALPLERFALLDSITQNNPMIKMLNAEKDAFEAQKRMARLEGRPMIGAGVTYMSFTPRIEDGSSMGGQDMIMPMVRLTLPIYRRKYKALFNEAEFKQKAVEKRRENTANQLATEWSNGLRDLDDATRRTKLYREQTDLARQTLGLLMTAYTTDGRDFEEVLRVQQQLLDYQLKLIIAIVDQHTSIAMLETLASTELN